MKYPRLHPTMHSDMNEVSHGVYTKPCAGAGAVGQRITRRENYSVIWRQFWKQNLMLVLGFEFQIAQPNTSKTCNLSILHVVSTCQQLATILSISLRCNKPVGVRLVATCHLQTCYKLQLQFKNLQQTCG